MRPPKDAEHLFRMAMLFVLGLGIFVAVRSFLVPKSFGQYGHYRGAAIAEIASRPIKFAGEKTCADCHEDTISLRQNGAHKSVRCEACHGALASHVDDPSVELVKLDTAKLCVTCHEMRPGKPVTFPQIASREHSEGKACESCHKPHKPAYEEEAKK